MKLSNILLRKDRYFTGLAAMTLLWALALPSTSEAQVLYGSIVGNVKDSSGAAVPGASVTITNRSTNQSRETVSNEIGNYRLVTVQPGLYILKVNLPGFKESVQNDISVSLNTITRANITLEVGQVQETVTVTANATVLQTDRAEVKSELPSKALQDLPVPLGRNYQSLFKIVPGFNLPENAHSIPSNPSRALRFNVNGTSGSSNNIRVDGVTGTNVWLPHMTSYIPALESIDTVNIVTNSFDAEQGLAGGAAVNVQIKSGTNELHGSAFEYHSDNALKAKNFFLPQGERNPKNIYNQLGGTIGGPIVKDKLFYFVSYEGTFDHQFASRFVTIPTPKMKRGDFTETTALIYDPATGSADGRGRTPFPGNIIPSNRIDPIAARIAALIPDPNIANLPANQFTNNYYGAGSFSLDRNTVDTKINWNVTPKFNMNGRYSILKYTMQNPEIFGESLGGIYVSGYGGNSGHGFGSTHSITVGGNYIFSPKFIVDANFGWTKMNTSVEQCCLDKKIGLDVLGIPGTNGPRRFEGGWPRFSISGFTNLGVQDAFMPYYRFDPQWQYTANANWIKGKHNIRYGLDFSIQHLNHTQPEFPGATHGAQGGFSFAGGPTSLNGGASSNNFNSFATFMLGLPTTIGKILQVPDMYTTRTQAFSLYVRDQWQVDHRLTLSLGLRWENFPMPTREDRGMERYDLINDRMFVCGIGSVPDDCGTKVSKKLFAPRFGFAYRITEDFVLRAGYGITIDPYNLARPLRTNHPLLLASNFTSPNSFSWAGTLKEGIPLVKAPDLGNGIIDRPGTVGVNTMDQNFRRGYIQSWNLTLQKKLWHEFVGQIGYVATRQTRQLGFLDLNVGTIGGARASQPFFQKFGRTARTAVVGPVGGSHYDSMQMTVDRRFAGGFSSQLAYTWSKAIGIASVSNSDNEPSIKRLEYYHLNRGRLGINRTHNFHLANIVELPFGPGRKWVNTGGVLGAVVGGWQINSIWSVQSGSPFTVTASGSSLNSPGNSQRADQVKPEIEILGGHGRGVSWFDPFAFAPVTTARFGTAGFNILDGPSYWNLDLGIFREFKITEQTRIQFRAEAFNFTNTPHFGNPGTNRSSLQLNADGTIRSLGGYTEITSTRGTGREGIDERQFRFGLRVSF
jgi:hypothetical protein